MVLKNNDNFNAIKVFALIALFILGKKNLTEDKMEGAFKTGKYRNVFAELGYEKEEIEKRKEEFDRLWK